jgi:hypothetical protein
VVCAACQREGVVNAPETELASAEQLTMFLTKSRVKIADLTVPSGALKRPPMLRPPVKEGMNNALLS